MKVLILCSILTILFSCSSTPSKEMVIVKQEAYNKREITGFYIKGKHLAVYLPGVVFRATEKDDDHENIKRLVPINICNTTKKLFIVDINLDSISISSSVTSDDNYDNLSNHLPVNKVLSKTDIGSYALHPANDYEPGFRKDYYFLRNQESYTELLPEINIVSFHNSCALLSVKLSYREMNSDIILTENFDIPISTGQNWYYWQDYISNQLGAKEVFLKD